MCLQGGDGEMSAKTAKQTRGVRGWGVWTDRCICEDKLITAIRGGEGQTVPMSRYVWQE